MEFSRRAKNLYADREAVVDGDLRFSYAEFLERCDRWSNALQKLGVKQGECLGFLGQNGAGKTTEFFCYRVFVGIRSLRV